jgi:putative redox protein
MKKTVSGFEIVSNGIRKEEYPTACKTIILQLNVKSQGITSDDLDKVIKLSEETYCPVWLMFKGNVEISAKYDIISRRSGKCWL